VKIMVCPDNNRVSVMGDGEVSFCEITRRHIWDVLAVFLPCVPATEEERDNLANPAAPA